MVSYNTYLKFSVFMILLIFLDSGCPCFFLVNQSADLNGVSPSCSPASPGGSLRWMVLMCSCRTHGRPQGDWDLCRFGKIPGVSGLLGSGLQPMFFVFLGGTWFPKDIKVGFKAWSDKLVGGQILPTLWWYHLRQRAWVALWKKIPDDCHTWKSRHETQKIEWDWGMNTCMHR